MEGKNLFIVSLHTTKIIFFQFVDANRSIEDVHTDIGKLLQEAVGQISKETPLKKLWSWVAINILRNLFQFYLRNR